jgi:hypothetical protein
LYFTPDGPSIEEPYLEIIIGKEEENDVEGLIIQKKGTIFMLKTALKYTIDKYPHIEYFTITDKTISEITPKRLLEGSKGWYEEHFNAKPSVKTKRVIDIIKKCRIRINELIINIIGKSEWNNKNILRICNKIDGAILAKNILRTVWTIDSESIKKY